jgi:hypothetical protein
VLVQVVRFGRRGKAPAKRTILDRHEINDTLPENNVDAALSIPREASVINEIETQCTPVKVCVIQVQTERPIMIDKQV